jgi:ubiquinone/menaquinone biosynthesis C-methylase UbiE
MINSPFEGMENLPEARINASFLEGKKVLDLGCGLMSLKKALDGKVKTEVTTLDVRKKVNPDICCDILGKGGIPVDDETYDVVYACHFMEHFMFDEWNHYDGWDDLNIVLREVKRVLKMGGSFIVVVPSPHSGMAVSPDHKSVYSHMIWSKLLGSIFDNVVCRGVGTWVEIPELYDYMSKLAVSHPFFGREYSLWCKKC